jgi:hypothetical protein
MRPRRADSSDQGLTHGICPCQSGLFFAWRAKVQDLSSIRYLQKYLKGTIHWLNTGARFGSSAEKEEALRLAEQARQLYAELEKS